MIQFDEHIFQMGWFNHQLVCHASVFWGGAGVVLESNHVMNEDVFKCWLRILSFTEISYPTSSMA